MDMAYLGKLRYVDPLYDILLSQVCPGLREPVFHVNKMDSFEVYKYTEEKTGVAVIGKFFKLNDPEQERILRKRTEYENLQKIRAYGFDSFPNYVVRPISRDEKIGLALLEEFIDGQDLDHYLKKAIFQGNGNLLKKKLSKLASFLYALHKRTETETGVDLESMNAYFQKLLKKLSRQAVISDLDRKEYLRLMDQWLNQTLLQEAKEVIVHGDATPTNFLFSDTDSVAAIDLERMKNADAVFDLGIVCGEIKHAFLWRSGNGYEAEPFIRYFFESYSSHYDDRKKAFKKITARNPFYMAMAELRIARNNYLDFHYRKRLAFEALQCLEWGLRLK